MPAPMGKRRTYPGARRPTGRPLKYKKKSIGCIDKPEQIARCLTCPVPAEYCKGSATCAYLN